MGAQVARILLRLLLIPIVLRYFGAEVKGLLDLTLAVAAIMLVAVVPTGQYVNSVTPALADHGRWRAVRGILWRTYGVEAAAQLAVSAIMFLLADPIASLYGHAGLAPLIRLFAVASLANILRSPLNRAGFLALGHYRAAFVADVFPLAAEAAATFYVVGFGRGAEDYLLWTTLAPALGFIAGWWMFLTKVPLGTETAARPAWAELAGFVRHIWLNSILLAAYQRMGVLLVGLFFPLQVVAAYGLASSVLLLGWTVASVPEALLLRSWSVAAESSPARLLAAIEQGTRTTGLYAALLATVFGVWSAEIIHVLGGPEFAAAAPVLAIFALFPLANAPDTARYLFYVRKDPGVITRRWSTLVIGQYVVTVAVLFLDGVLAAALVHVALRCVFSYSITKAAAARVETAGRWLARIWRRTATVGAGVAVAASISLAVDALALPPVPLVALRAALWLALLAFVLYAFRITTIGQGLRILFRAEGA